MCMDVKSAISTGVITVVCVPGASGPLGQVKRKREASQFLVSFAQIRTRLNRDTPGS
jgi:hypothetical protein